MGSPGRRPAIGPTAGEIRTIVDEILLESDHAWAMPSLQATFDPRIYQRVYNVLNMRADRYDRRTHHGVTWWWHKGCPDRLCDVCGAPATEWIGGCIDRSEERRYIAGTGGWTCSDTRCRVKVGTDTALAYLAYLGDKERQSADGQ